jgi:hypothetical protein
VEDVVRLEEFTATCKLTPLDADHKVLSVFATTHGLRGFREHDHDVAIHVRHVTP